ncbi:MAG: ArsR/SmtB family transcription factor [Athalassotoga sp.]|uniref:ArsR/SmtB family transcription factor n=1 Tax=Athalassotoga sp. TaxID=2022597 RepID=UPI003D02717D
MDSKKFEKFFSALSSPLRLRMVLLMAKRPFCVCELENVFDVTQPAISQNLKILKDANLIIEKREKQWVFYSTNREILNALLEEFFELLGKESTFTEIVGLKISDLPKDPQRSCEILENRKKEILKNN